MVSGLPARALAGHCGSASSGRASETMSAWPSASTRSATSGMLIRLTAITGTPTCGRSLAVTAVKAARGTEVAMVGTRASCQPMPELIRVAPAASMARASSRISAQLLPSATRSSSDSR